MPRGRVLVELVNVGFERARSDWIDHYHTHVTPALRHLRVLLPPPAGSQRRSGVLEAWNANATLPPAAFEAALRALADPNTCLVDASRLAPAAEAHAARHQRMANITLGACGFCGVTEAGSAGDCSHGRKGAFDMWKLGISDLATCAAACRTCARCDFVSYQTSGSDCSWFHRSACDASKLKESHSPAFVTTRVRHAPRTRKVPRPAAATFRPRPDLLIPQNITYCNS